MAGNHMIPIVPPANQPKGLLNGQIEKDLEAYLKAQMELKQIQKEIKKLAALLHASKDPMLMIQEILGKVMDMQGDKVSTYSAASQVGTDVRDEISKAQGDMNAIGGGTGDPTTEAAKLVEFVNQMQTFINTEMGAGKGAAVGKTTLDNLQQAIDQIKDQFHTGTKGDKDYKNNWGDAKAMGKDALGWTTGSKKGEYPQQYKNVMDGFQTLNQTVSAFATSTSTELQFNSKQYEQYMGTLQNFNSSWLKWQQVEVSNQRSQ